MGHKEGSELLRDLEELKAHINIGNRFDCPGYSEIEYVVTYLGFVESTEEPCIIYKKKENGQTSWVRTFNEYLNKDDLHTGKEQKQLLDELSHLKLRIGEGDVFYHYKHPDQTYRIVGVGFIEGSGQSCVIYQANYGDELVWVRTQDEFFSKITLEDGTEVDRFTKVV